MIITNLAMLLAQRQMKITRVASDTGISRTTLTALSKNNSKGVQLETMDTLCQYLSVSPADFFEYLPFDVSADVVITKNETFASDATISHIPIEKGDLGIDLYIKVKSYNSKALTFGYSGENATDTYWGAGLTFDLQRDENDSEFKPVWNKKITPGFRPVIWDNIKQEIVDKINENMTLRFTVENDFNIGMLQMEKGELELTTDFKTDVPNTDDWPF